MLQLLYSRRFDTRWLNTDTLGNYVKGSCITWVDRKGELRYFWHLRPNRPGSAAHYQRLDSVLPAKVLHLGKVLKTLKERNASFGKLL